MQFMTLLPDLIAEAAHVSVLVNNRLLPIYRRFYGSKKYKSIVTIVSFEDIKQGRVSPDLFHYQLRWALFVNTDFLTQTVMD